MNAFSFRVPNPFGSSFQTSIPRAMIFYLFFMGVGCSTYWLVKGSYSLYRGVYDKIRAMFNSGKYLKSECTDQKHQRYYAVIYGIHNKAGKAYARFLAEKGFNLILIERHKQPLDQLEDMIHKEMPNNQLEIHKIVLAKFD